MTPDQLSAIEDVYRTDDRVRSHCPGVCHTWPGHAGCAVRVLLAEVRRRGDVILTLTERLGEREGVACEQEGRVS